MSALLVNNVTICYGAAQAVHNVSFSVPEGAIVTIIGPNGAGKTTLLSAIAGLLPFTGRMRFGGKPLPSSLEQRVEAGIALVPESRALFASMSVEDNLRLGAWRLGRRLGAARLDGIYAQFPRLRERRRQRAGTLSGGERQMLALGRALMGEPRLLLLDEPSLGLAPLIVKQILDGLGPLRQTGVSILLVEQNARAALAIADIGYVLENGRITQFGSGADLARDPRVLATYLGEG